jgi:DNA-directed RNA polymerase subunit RPC12/RpoP
MKAIYICKNCGGQYKLSAGAVYCPRCGMRLSEQRGRGRRAVRYICAALSVVFLVLLLGTVDGLDAGTMPQGYWWHTILYTAALVVCVFGSGAFRQEKAAYGEDTPISGKRNNANKSVTQERRSVK